MSLLSLKDFYLAPDVSIISTHVINEPLIIIFKHISQKHMY